MVDLLKRLKLIDHMTTELEISRKEFLSRLQEIVEDRSIGFFADSFDPFVSSKREYKGQVGVDGFRIKRLRRFFDFNLNLAVANGTIRQSDEKLIIETEIKGFNKMVIPFFAFLAVVYLFALISMLLSPAMNHPVMLIMIPFIFLHAVLMVGIPYYMMRKSTSRLKYELEREFYYLTRR